MAALVGAVTLLDRGTGLVVDRRVAGSVAAGRLDQQRDGLAVQAGDLVPTAFQSAAVRRIGPGVDDAERRAAVAILDQVFGVAQAAAGEHRLDVGRRHAVARHQHARAGRADGGDRNRTDAQFERERAARHADQMIFEGFRP